jgi:HAE1 family hydrophobic/amphiphilic exporter-1
LIVFLLGKRLPASFLPEEDYGYAFLNVQLPAAASLSRTDEVLRKIEKIIAQNEGVQYTSTVGGFSLLTRTSATYQGFFFLGLKPWDERTSKQLQASVDRDKVLKQGVAVADVYLTLQAYLGGLYLNQFNRFGRQWRVFLQTGTVGQDAARSFAARAP